MIGVNNNIVALGSQKRLGEASSRLQESFNRLSSGLRISRAKDDAAGLSIADSLAADKRIYNQGIRNINDGISLMNIAEGAVSELKNILFRIRELSTQASNGTIENEQRHALNQESDLLIEEYSRILDTTEFNGIRLFSEDATRIRIQAGYGSLGGVTIGVGVSTSGSGSSSGSGGPAYVGDGTFGAPTFYAVGDEPRSVTLGDFDSDGHLDLVVTNTASNSLSVLLGNGDGTFAASATYATGGSQPTAAVLGDFDGDGFLDLVVANYLSSNLGVRLGNGDGTFGDQTIYSSGGLPGIVLTSDLNGDDDLDLVSINPILSQMSVLLGNGDGTFAASATYAIGGSQPTAAALGDFDGDGVMDLVSAGSGNLRVLLGNGDGTFAAPTIYAVGDNPRSVSVGDFDGDGHFDLVIANYASNSLGVLIGNGDGTFTAPTTYMVGSSPHAVSNGDLNGDGVMDLVVANYASNNLGVLFGNGDGTFAAQTTYTAGSSPRSVSVGDFDGDGSLDLVSANQYSNDLSVLLGNGVFAESSAPQEQGITLVPLEGINLSSRGGALVSQPVIDGYLEDVNKVLGNIGAGVARLETAASKLRVEVENYAAAESQIRDVDVATESAKLVRNQILQQASAAVLGQANIQPEIALKLLT